MLTAKGVSDFPFFNFPPFSMIAYLSGTIQKKLPKNIILTLQNIGYLVSIPTPLHERINEKDAIELYIYTKVREDDISLYGFEKISELEFFKLLLGVNGIGPKLALEMLSQDSGRTKLAIINNDVIFLSKIPGIGKKTAERISMELKNKVTLEDIGTLPGNLEITKNSDAITALETLGYQRFEILKILKDLPEKLRETEEIITYFLRNV